MSGWPRYLANTWLEEARLTMQVGDSTQARVAYRQFLALRDDPELPLASEVDAVKSLVEPHVVSADTTSHLER